MLMILAKVVAEKSITGPEAMSDTLAAANGDQ